MYFNLRGWFNSLVVKNMPVFSFKELSNYLLSFDSLTGKILIIILVYISNCEWNWILFHILQSTFLQCEILMLCFIFNLFLIDIHIKGFSGGSAVKDLPANAGDPSANGFHLCVGKITWRRKWQPAPVFLPEKPHGQRRLVGYSPQGHRESDTT